MISFVTVIPVFLPIIAGLLLLAFPNAGRKTRNITVLCVSLLNLGLVIFAALGDLGAFELLRINDDYTLMFRIDGAGRLFGLLVSALWPFALIYAFDYMKQEERQNSFFAFYIMTLGSVLGIAFAGDIITMYVFYEMLTLFTYPLVMHSMTNSALKAGTEYLVYMLGGAAFSFVGIIVVVLNAGSSEFVLGGILQNLSPEMKGMMTVMFIIIFCGFGVKAALMPFGRWLIHATVAPMPVTALLHAVAVVKSGAFAIIRLIYYIYGADYLRGTWGQYAAILLVSCTILYGSFMAVREPHLKRRMAYSTISNLSYILFGAVLMSPLGMVGAFSHIIAHAVSKLVLFYSVGAIMHITGKEYVYQTDGLARKWKLTYALFTVAACSLIGVPVLAGFTSKIRLIIAALDTDNAFAYIGMYCIILSALLTAIYLMTMVVRAYFPKENICCQDIEEIGRPGAGMLVPIGICALAAVLFGIFGGSLVECISGVLGV